MRRVFLVLALLASPLHAQPIPEDQLCLTPIGIGALEDGKCRPLPGDKREIKPAQLPIHLRNDFRLKLNVVSADNPEEDYDLSSLSNNDTVTELELFRVGPIDMSPLPSMQALRALSLSAQAARSLGQLSTPPATVRDLRLYAPGDVLDLSALASWTGLRVLNVIALGVTGQEALANLPHLQDVTFDLGQQTDLSVLANAKKLEALHIRGSLGRTVFSDASFVAGLADLRMLSLETNAITDLTPLAGLTKLRGLALSGNKGVTDISVVRNMPDLRSLQLDKTNVSDLSPLRGMAKLEILWLDRAPVSDISALAETPALWGLKLVRTQVSDLSPLRNLPLRHLNVIGAPVTDFSPVPPGVKLKK